MKMEIWSGRSSDGSFRIRVTDDAARCCFLEIKMTPENFANMLANQPVECEGEIHNLNRVGKTRMRESRSAMYSGKDTSKETVRQWLIEGHKGDGWEMNDTLSSQSSMIYNNAGYYVINYAVEKWV